MTGWPPPRPPRFLGDSPELCPSSPRPAGSSRDQQGLKVLDVDRYELPPSRPPASSTTEVCRTGPSPTPTQPSDVTDGFPRSAVSEQTPQCTRPVVPPRDRHQRSSPDQALLPTCSPSS